MTLIKPAKTRLVSGIQPTGRMHLGNYLGAVSNWVKLQHDYDAYILVVDLHSLTSVYENPAQLRADKLELAIDLLASGIDPEKCCLFNQSEVPGHSELHLILSMITPLAWLERVPSYKDKKDAIKDKDLNTYGFLGYPTLQTADIILYKGEVVPVGKDQIPHIELAREITRRFNHLYRPIFPEPMEMLTEFPTLPGIDGQKMSKSYNNTLPISDNPDVLHKKVMSMLTDPKRQRRTDPGTPEICPVYSYHQIFNTEDRKVVIAEQCRSAELGCVDCKRECAGLVVDFLKPVHERRKHFASDIGEVKNILKKGAEKARHVAEATLVETREAIGL